MSTLNRLHPQITTIDDLASTLDPDACRRLVAETLTIFGSGEWDTDIFTALDERLRLHLPIGAAVPSHGGENDAAREFYARLAAREGWEHNYDGYDEPGGSTRQDGWFHTATGEPACGEDPGDDADFFAEPRSVPTCSRCGAPWGHDETCRNCVDEHGTPREPVGVDVDLGPGVAQG